MQIIKGKFCGKYLSDTLTELCDGVYNTIHKRNMNTNGKIALQHLHFTLIYQYYNL